MKIKVKEITEGCKFEMIDKGDWIDLKAAVDVNFVGPQSGVLETKRVDGKRVSYRDVTFDHKYIPLGIAMKLPEGYEAVVLPRSSTISYHGIIIANGQAVIDNTYCGNDDQWHFSAIALRHSEIPKGSRICQFRVQLSQKATVWQKIKWLFTSKIEFEWVDDLGDNNRGGLGSTGTK